MLNIRTADELADIIDQFQIPIFAAERSSVSAPFRMITTNTAYQRATGHDASDLRGVTIQNILPKDQAITAIDHFQDCITAKKSIRFLETLTCPHGNITFDTSLQHAPQKDGIERVIGLSLPIRDIAPQENNHMAFDDINFFAALAEIQLQNLVSVFDAVQENDLFRNDSSARTAQLAGICRGIQQAIRGIRHVADQGGKAKVETVQKEAEPIQPSKDLGGCTLRALVERERVFEDVDG